MIDYKQLTYNEWKLKVNGHHHLVGPYCEAFTKRRDTGLKHPVHDFLFTYYSCSPLKLKQWIPNYQEKLKIEFALEEYPWLNEEWFLQEEGYLFLNLKRVSKTIPSLLNFIIELCQNISKKLPKFSCFGLHEWAMVYKASKAMIRHQSYPLRLSQEQLDRFVESQSLRCTHYDAYRFFTPEASPFNLFKPTLESRLQLEQGGCVHANMDLYKWSSKLWPWIGSDFIAKTFLLALKGRELDMRASPYDLSKDGYEPIKIETEEGRRLYQIEQQKYAREAQELREELLDFCLQFAKILS